MDWFDGGGADTAAAAAAASTLLSPSHAPSLAPALADAAGAHPRLHGAWTTLLALALPGFVADCAPTPAAKDGGSARTHAAPPPAAPPAPLRALWAAAVDASLLTAASPARRAAALALAGVALPRCGPEAVPCVLTPSTARALASATRDPASPLHAAATRTLDRVVALAKDRGARWAAAAAAALTAGAPARGGAGFDARSGTKAVGRLLEAAGDGGASAYADELMVVAEAALAAAAAAAPAGAAAAAGSDDDDDGDDAPTDPTGGAGAALDQLATAAARGGVEARARVAGWLARVALTARARAPPAARAVAAARALGLAAAAGPAGDAALTAACDAVDAALARGGGGLVAEGEAAEATAALARAAAAATAAATPSPTPTTRAAPSLPDAIARLAKLWRLYVLADSDGDGAAVAAGAASDFEDVARAALAGDNTSPSSPSDDPWPDRLVGIVLALASAAPAPPLPAAPLRDAAEALLSSAAPHVTPAGVAEIAAVVADDAVVEGEEDEEEDEEEEEEEEASSDDDQQPSLSAAAPSSAAAPAHSASASDSDASSICDDAMFALDGAIAAVLRGGADVRADARAAAAARSALRLRAAALLDGYARRAPPDGGAALVPAVPTLLAAAGRAGDGGGGSGAALADRLHGLLSSRLPSLRPSSVPPSMPDADYAAALDAARVAATRGRGARAPAAGAGALLFLVRAGARAGGAHAAAAAAAATAVATDAITSKKTRVKRSTLAALAGAGGGLAAAVAAGAAKGAATPASDCALADAAAAAAAALDGARATGDDASTVAPAAAAALAAAARGAYGKPRRAVAAASAVDCGARARSRARARAPPPPPPTSWPPCGPPGRRCRPPRPRRTARWRGQRRCWLAGVAGVVVSAARLQPARPPRKRARQRLDVGVFVPAVFHLFLVFVRFLLCFFKKNERTPFIFVQKNNHTLSPSRPTPHHRLIPRRAHIGRGFGGAQGCQGGRVRVRLGTQNIGHKRFQPLCVANQLAQVLGDELLLCEEAVEGGWGSVWEGWNKGRVFFCFVVVLSLSPPHHTQPNLSLPLTRLLALLVAQALGQFIQLGRPLARRAALQGGPLFVKGGRELRRRVAPRVEFQPHRLQARHLLFDGGKPRPPPLHGGQHRVGQPVGGVRARGGERVAIERAPNQARVHGDGPPPGGRAREHAGQGGGQDSFRGAQQVFGGGFGGGHLFLQRAQVVVKGGRLLQHQLVARVGGGDKGGGEEVGGLFDLWGREGVSAPRSERSPSSDCAITAKQPLLAAACARWATLFVSKGGAWCDTRVPH